MINQFDGQYRWLSNFYPCIIMMHGDAYQSVEHAYQAAKTNDPALRKVFQLHCISAGSAKRAGRKIPIRPDWNDIKLKVMTKLVTRKFEHPELLTKLLATGNEELVEGNWWGDTYWGVCAGKGANHLGHIIMQIRKDSQP